MAEASTAIADLPGLHCELVSLLTDYETECCGRLVSSPTSAQLIPTTRLQYHQEAMACAGESLSCRFCVEALTTPSATAEDFSVGWPFIFQKPGWYEFVINQTWSRPTIVCYDLYAPEENC